MNLLSHCGTIEVINRPFTPPPEPISYRIESDDRSGWAALKRVGWPNPISTSREIGQHN